MPERLKRYQRVEMTPQEMDLFGIDGDPVWAVVQSSLTFLEIERIKTEPRVYEDLFRLMAPLVVEWNVQGLAITRVEDPKTNRVTMTEVWEPVDSPAEAGWEVFKTIQPDIYMWLRNKLTTVSFGGQDRKNVSREPAGTVALAADETSDSLPPRKKTRTSRQSRPDSAST
jgi:hypothetical protein